MHPRPLMTPSGAKPTRRLAPRTRDKSPSISHTKADDFLFGPSKPQKPSTPRPAKASYGVPPSNMAVSAGRDGRQQPLRKPIPPIDPHRAHGKPITTTTTTVTTTSLSPSITKKPFHPPLLPGHRKLPPSPKPTAARSAKSTAVRPFGVGLDVRGSPPLKKHPVVAARMSYDTSSSEEDRRFLVKTVGEMDDSVLRTSQGVIDRTREPNRERLIEGTAIGPTRILQPFAQPSPLSPSLRPAAASMLKGFPALDDRPPFSSPVSDTLQKERPVEGVERNQLEKRISPLERIPVQDIKPDPVGPSVQDIKPDPVGAITNGPSVQPAQRSLVDLLLSGETFHYKQLEHAMLTVTPLDTWDDRVGLNGKTGIPEMYVMKRWSRVREGDDDFTSPKFDWVDFFHHVKGQSRRGP